jgi:hypothetical protein
MSAQDLQPTEPLPPGHERNSAAIDTPSVFGLEGSLMSTVGKDLTDLTTSTNHVGKSRAEQQVQAARAHPLLPLHESETHSPNLHGSRHQIGGTSK